VAYIILNTGFSDVQLRETVRTTESVRETLTEGWGFVKDVPAFRYLAMALLSLAICDVIVEFRFLAVSDLTFPAPAQYQTFYSIYRLSYTVAALLIQTFISGRLIDKLGIQHTFLIFPSTVLVGALWMLGWPGIVSAVGGLVLVKLPEYTVDESARKAFQALVPEERRGRVSVFLDSYLYVGGSLLGIGVLGLMLLLGNVMPTVDNFYIYLTLVVAAALFALWSIVQLRKVYEESLWNWRLKRRQRRVSSVLDKLEF
jgi:ATP/ADP translocase